MEVKVETITPARAQELLEANKSNRPLSASRAQGLASAMMRGEWQDNGDTIRIAEDGVLLDGQHRLTAIIESGVPQRYIIVSGLPRDTFKTIDIGSPRTAGDAISMAGFDHSGSVATVARMIINWRSGGNPVSTTADKRPTNTQVLEEAQNNPLIAEAVEYALGNRWLKKYLTPNATGFMYVAGADRDKEKVIAFLDEVAGEEHVTNSATQLLRERLLENYGSKAKLPRREILALTMKAFRSYCEGVSPKTLRVRLAGDAKEKDVFRVQ